MLHAPFSKNLAHIVNIFAIREFLSFMLHMPLPQCPARILLAQIINVFAICEFMNYIMATINGDNLVRGECTVDFACQPLKLEELTSTTSCVI